MASDNMDYFTKLIMKDLEKMQRRADQVSQEVTEELGKEADEYAKKIMNPAAKIAIEEEFRSAVSGWYGTYSPRKYKRTDSLYTVLRIPDPDEPWGWQYYDDDLDHPSIIKKGGAQAPNGTFNIYDLVFKEGYHGNVIGWAGYYPQRNKSIQDVFEEAEVGLFDEMQAEFDRYGHEYFDERFADRFWARYNMYT